MLFSLAYGVGLTGHLLQARERPYVLDGHTVARVFGEQVADYWLLEEQLRRWAAGLLTRGPSTGRWSV